MAQNNLQYYKYANIIIDISHEKVDKTFAYKIPDSLKDRISVGSCVIVPFGRGNIKRKGYVLELTNKSSFAEDKLKFIEEIEDKELPAEDVLIKLAAWMKNRYGSTMYAALKTVLPASSKQNTLKHKFILLKTPKDEAQKLIDECQKKHRTAQERLLRELLSVEDGRLSYELVTGKLAVSSSTIKSLEQKDIIEIISEEYYRNPVKDSKIIKNDNILSDEQNAIVSKVTRDFKSGITKTYLIHGITGSGKTEVYIRLIENMVSMGKSAIVLIPEISLTYQTLLRFYSHFGDRVSVMNSTLSKGEKFDQFMRARNGDIDVIIGPRSALFTPFNNLGLVIIDEEHEPAYKSETMPKYHARETAIELARLTNASVVLGSATPSLDAYYKAQNGEIELFKLTKRLTGGFLPKVSVVDLRSELKSGNRSIFSKLLQKKIEDRLNKKQQTMLFINRRGLAGFVSCRSCGYVFKCPHCDVSLSEHRGGKLVCHYCGYTENIRRICPKCGSKYVSAFRAGTQQIENEVHKFWPNARVLRMDADTTKSKDSYKNILSAFANGEADILVGTQMIVKGHDFKKVSLVGVLAADMSLAAGDYRASERTFQLLTQAAGRAGRGDVAGEVVIQSYDPEHYAIECAKNQDYEAFYEKEIEYRKLLNYPPVSHMLSIQIMSQNEEEGITFSNRLRAVIEQKNNTLPSDMNERAVIIGPAAAGISKINDVFRFVIYVKTSDYGILTLIKEKIENYISYLTDTGQYKGYFVQLDFDPINAF